MSENDEFWTPEDLAEFAEIERDDAAVDPDAPPFPEGWTEVGATPEPVEVLLEDAEGNGLRNAAMRYLALGPARIFTQPVKSPIFEAIDRASEDRTPVLEGELPSMTNPASWIKIDKAVAEWRASVDVPVETSAFQQALETMTVASAGFAEATAGAAKTAESAYDTLRKFYQQYLPPRREIALVGTGKRRHAVPYGKRPAGMSRAEHARRRQLYSERLRRDRRRIRGGRAPILRSSPFELLIPNAQINVTESGPEYMGMEIVAHPWVPEDQVYIVDTSVLNGYRFTEPHDFLKDPLRTRSRFTDQAALYGYGLSPTGRFRTTSYFQQMLGAYEAERPDWGWGGHSADVIAVDETVGWLPEHSSDVDRWISEGGADRG